MAERNKEESNKKDGDAQRHGEALSINIMKSLNRKQNSESGSSNGGNNSDNSALVSFGGASFGNTSFGFNFDSEEGMSNSTPLNSEQNGNSSDSDGNGNYSKPPAVGSNTAVGSSTDENIAVAKKNATAAAAALNKKADSKGGDRESAPAVKKEEDEKPSPVEAPTDSTTNNTHDPMQFEAAQNAAASLQSIAEALGRASGGNFFKNFCAAQQQSLLRDQQQPVVSESGSSGRKRKGHNRSDDSCGGYNSDDENGDQKKAAGGGSSCGRGSDSVTSCDTKSTSQHQKGGKRKKRIDDKKREERNAREKERSFRISKQINELRNLLSNGGVIVPKGTKSSVLTEAANYIRMLQQHQYRSEMDRNQLVHQMQLIGGGAHGPQAASVIRHVAAQNGVWSLGNFGGLPPKSAMSFYQGNTVSDSSQQSMTRTANTDPMQTVEVESTDYRYIFNACGVGMAIASMGGAFIDCNQLFCQLSNYSKQELCALTIFNLTARQDLQPAFDLISQMISPPMDSRTQDPPKPIVLRGAMKNRDDLGLSIALVKGEDGIAKCICVTLIRNPSSPFDTSKPVPVSFESIQQHSGMSSVSTQINKSGHEDMNSSPAFTSG